MEYYFVISSEDSSELYEEEHAASFRVKLYNPLTLSGSWEIGLVSYDLVTNDTIDNSTTLLIHSSVCQMSTVIGGRYRAPVLRTIFYRGGITSWSYDTPSYVSVGQSFLDSINVNITGRDGVTPAFKTGKSYGVLHLRQCE